VLQRITQAARTLDIPLRWAQSEGDPVALLTIAAERNSDDHVTRLEHLELLDGEVYFTGRTERLKKLASPTTRPGADQARVKANRQR
jgi:hypothetical protein